ncbi:hypothetical protein D3C74_495380 [compost metagenome]
MQVILTLPYIHGKDRLQLNMHEIRFNFPGNRPCQERFSAARRAEQQQAAASLFAVCSK